MLSSQDTNGMLIASYAFAPWACSAWIIAGSTLIGSSVAQEQSSPVGGSSTTGSTGSTGSSTTLFSTQCLDEFVALSVNGTTTAAAALNLLVRSEYLDGELAQSTCVGTERGPVSNNSICVYDFRQTNTSAYQTLCETNGTAINASMIQYNIAMECIRSPYVYEVWMDVPLCMPNACGQGLLTARQVQDLYNQEYAKPAQCFAAFIPTWYQTGRQGSSSSSGAGGSSSGDCRNETLTLTWNTRVTSPILVEKLHPYAESVDSCQGDVSSSQSLCVVDYRLANTSKYETICTALGGTMLRHDVSVQCTLDNGDVTTVTVLSEPRCVGPSCTAQEALDAANYVPAREMNFYFDEFILDASCVLTVAEPSDAAFVAPTKPTSTAFHYRQQFLCTKWVMTAVTTALLLILT